MILSNPGDCNSYWLPAAPPSCAGAGVNLLGGRARIRRLFPFVSAEAPNWDLMRAVNVGGIPSIWFSDDPVEDLRAYCGSYLQLEIQAEGLVRGVERFSRFLTAAALALRSAGGVRAAGLRRRRARAHGARVLPGAGRYAGGRRCFSHSPRSGRAASRYRTPSSTCSTSGSPTSWPGLTRIEAGSAAFGRALEHLVFCELSARLGYSRDAASTHVLAYGRRLRGSTSWSATA